MQSVLIYADKEDLLQEMHGKTKPKKANKPNK